MSKQENSRWSGNLIPLIFIPCALIVWIVNTIRDLRAHPEYLSDILVSLACVGLCIVGIPILICVAIGVVIAVIGILVGVVVSVPTVVRWARVHVTFFRTTPAPVQQSLDEATERIEELANLPEEEFESNTPEFVVEEEATSSVIDETISLPIEDASSSIGEREL